MTTDRKPNDTDWLRRAIIKIFYYPQSHLAQTLTLWRNHCDEISDKTTVTQSLVCGKFVHGRFTWLVKNHTHV